MPIPLWGATAYGGKLYQLDDPSVGADWVDGGTSNPYQATIVTSPFSAGPNSYSSLRRFIMNVDTPTAIQIDVQPMRDRQLAGTNITRTLQPTAARDVTFPQKVTGTEFQESITLSNWSTATAPSASIGMCAAVMVVRRSERGGDDT